MYLHTMAYTGIACCAFIGGIYAGGIKTDNQLALEACARENNVYQCKWEAVPNEPPRVLEVMPELLPPPVEG